MGTPTNLAGASFGDDFFQSGLIFNRGRYPWKALLYSVCGHVVAIYTLVSYSAFVANLPPAERPPNLAKARIIEMELPRLRPFLPARPKETPLRPARADKRKAASAPSKDASPLEAPVPRRAEARRFVGPSLHLTPEPRPVPAPTLILETPQLAIQPQLQVPSILVLSNRTQKLPPRTFVRPPEQAQKEPPQAVVLETEAPRITPGVGTIPVPRTLAERPVLPVLPAPTVPVSGEAPKIAETSTTRNPKPDQSVTLIAQPEFRVPPSSSVAVPPGSQLGGSVSQLSSVSVAASATAGGTSAEIATRAEGRPTPNRGEADTTGSQANAQARVSSTGSGSGTPGPGAEGGSGRSGIAVERVVLPRDGKYDVVITQNAGIVASTASFLSARPVYSVYVRVGQKGDWILQYCFPVSQQQPPPRRSSVVQLSKAAPLAGPYAFLLLRPSVTFKQASPYAYIHGIINAEGRFEKLQEVGGHFIENVADVLDALAGWEFRPATRDGQPTAVEVLLCIPNPLA